MTADKEKRLAWTRKAFRGKHPYEVTQSYVGSIAQNTWLTWGGLFPETQGFVCAIQDQVVNTKNYRKFIIKDGTVHDLWRQCKSAVGNMQHIISGFQTLTVLEYKARHDSAAKILHCL